MSAGHNFNPKKKFFVWNGALSRALFSLTWRPSVYQILCLKSSIIKSVIVWNEIIHHNCIKKENENITKITSIANMMIQRREIDVLLVSSINRRKITFWQRHWTSYRRKDQRVDVQIILSLIGIAACKWIINRTIKTDISQNRDII